MVFTYNLLIASFISFFIFIAFVLYFKIRQRFPKQEICWFCNKSQKVSYNRINSFNCIHCHQYNGFCEDGNYNKVMSAQFKYRNIRFCEPISDSFSKSTQLCSECNVRQEIKIKLLAQFCPFNENNFTQELDEYKKYLENEYKLCSNCETTVKNVLKQPINCLKDFISKSIRSKDEPNIDSLFVRQKSKTKSDRILSSIIGFFECINLFCAIIIFVFGLNEFQNNTEIAIIEFSENFLQYLESYASKQTFVIFSGIVCSLISIIISAKNSLLTTKIFSQLLWIALISCESPLTLSYMDKIDSILLRPILSLFVIFFSAFNSFLSFFPLFDTKFKVKQSLNQIKKQKQYLKETNNGVNVCSPESQVKCLNDTNKSADQLIGEQIKSLSILDKTDLTLNRKQSQHIFWTENNVFSNNRFNSESSNGKSIVLPAKFHYQSVAQTSWVSPFKPNTSPRKEKLNSSPYFTSSQSFVRTSQWVNHHISSLMTPPPSATTSVCSDSTQVNRFSSMDANNCLSANMSESQRNDFYNNQLKRSVPNGQQLSSRHSIKDNSIEESPVNGTLSSLHNKIANECLTQEKNRQNVLVNLTQSLVFALFLLILFCFVIFLSLPVVLKTSCDLNSMDCHFSIESLPQNNCFK